MSQSSEVSKVSFFIGFYVWLLPDTVSIAPSHGCLQNQQRPLSDLNQESGRFRRKFWLQTLADKSCGKQDIDQKCGFHHLFQQRAHSGGGHIPQHASDMHKQYRCREQEQPAVPAVQIEKGKEHQAQECHGNHGGMVIAGFQRAEADGQGVFPARISFSISRILLIFSTATDSSPQAVAGRMVSGLKKPACR